MAEILKIREITIDTIQHKDFNVKEEELKLIRFYQNDLNSAKLLINVTHDKVVTDFSSATSVQIAFLKPDCKRVFQDVQNVNQMQGKYYVVLSTQTLIAYGNVIAQLRFTFPNNKVIETCKFTFTVDESIMSDDVMKSINEFPVIQKAIEAGKKLEGVDIDGIIAAGELAKGAVKKSGDTMTGLLTTTDNIRFKAAGERNITWRDGNDTEYVKIYANSGGNRLGLWSTKNNKAVWEYHGDNDMLTVNGNTNLLKKTGDTMTGNLAFDVQLGEKVTRSFLGGIKYGAGFALNSRGLNLYDWSNNSNILDWESSTKTLTLANGVANTNIMKKTGDTVTGETIFRHNTQQQTSDGTSGIVSVINPSLNKWALGVKYDNVVDWSKEMAMDLKTGKVTVASLATKKDGRANLVLTADALVIDANSPPLVNRRGNTVTFRCYMQRKVGSSGNLMAILPVDMRPIDTVFVNALAHDGTICRVTIGTDGNVFIGSGGKETEGKQLAEIITYVAD